MSCRTMKNHGPIFPYRFSLDFCCGFRGNKPTDAPLGHCFCRWTLSNPDRALDWNDQGKGKGITILSSDGPQRCCSHLTPQLFLQYRIKEDLELLLPGTGRVYCAYLCGPGWYSANPGSTYFVRLVTNKDDVALLRAEAMIYDQEPPGIRREPLRPWAKRENADEPVAFHGFFQTDACDAAVIIFEFFDSPSEDDVEGEMNETPRKKKKGKKKRRNSRAL